MPPRSTDPHALRTPLFLLNLKAYPAALGPGALRIGRALEREGRRRRVAVALAAAGPDLGWLARELDIPVVAQHTDAGPVGAFTGRAVAGAVRAAGGAGSLLNHSERPLDDAQIRASLSSLRGEGLSAILCAATPARVRRLLPLRPPFLAIEPPELIGGKRSVSTARPEVITETVELARRLSPATRVLCGAGIHSRQDVKRAMELGSDGILVASAVTLSPSPSRAIRTLLSGFPAPPTR